MQGGNIRVLGCGLGQPPPHPSHVSWLPSPELGRRLPVATAGGPPAQVPAQRPVPEGVGLIQGTLSTGPFVLWPF